MTRGRYSTSAMDCAKPLDPQRQGQGRSTKIDELLKLQTGASFARRANALGIGWVVAAGRYPRDWTPWKVATFKRGGRFSVFRTTCDGNPRGPQPSPPL